ncbi:Glycerophosphocholine phosphodiesterase [Boothiomyces macroporosus]|uniref:Glycerophosphocholine phosphodiesterase n=1 Tax=Boothiomyces macroporosus TaxID=261099 RepID=A0AAD5UIP0_9FUNG|nr:Glycerophosphocholine phosphodiesterase [Boothiomyces macroporosus]
MASDQERLEAAVKSGMKDQVSQILSSATDINVSAAYELAVYNAQHELIKVIGADSRFKPAPVLQTPTEILLSGRKILNSENLIACHLGSFDLRNDTKQVSVEGLEDFKLKIHSKQGKPVSIDLHPVEILFTDFKDKVSSYFYFLTENVGQTVIEFDFLVGGKVCAKAVQKLNTTPDSLWNEKKPIGGRLEVPVYTFDMGIIGNVTLEYTVVKPCVGGTDERDPFGGSKTVLVGHRGAGANRKINIEGKSRLQLGENTVQSLIKGGEFGAEFVEFDVQLTQDHIPVIYHDFTTTEWGVHNPVSNIKFNDFVGNRPKLSRRNSSSNFNKNVEMATIKPNGAGTIQSAFCSLLQVFQKVPLKTGFNIEVKYPNLEEAQDETLNNAEINTFCDEILKVVFRNAGKRKLYFSSFHPEMCLLLRMKQKKYPVFYLTVAGAQKYYDVRLNSLADAVQVALDFKLDGVVTYCGPLIDCPALIKKIQNLGLNILSYGGKNNNIEDARIQVNAGINGIIVDNVPDIFRVINQQKE